MSIIKQGRRGIKSLVFGDTLLPQEFTVGNGGTTGRDCGMAARTGQPVDVTQRHSTACSDPFRVCIAFPEGQRPDLGSLSRLSLKFCERNGRKRVLGEIGLSQIENISIPELRARIIWSPKRNKLLPAANASLCSLSISCVLPMAQGEYLGNDNVVSRQTSGDGDVYTRAPCISGKCCW